MQYISNFIIPLQTRNHSFSRKKLDEIRSIAPEPPRRHCSNSTLRANGSLDQISEDYEAITLSGPSSVKDRSAYNSQDIYGYSSQVQGQVHGQMPPFYDSSNQMSLSMPSSVQQPIYANFNAVVNSMHPQKSLPNIQMTSSNHIQTRAEVHAEKIPFSSSNDSKVCVFELCSPSIKCSNNETKSHAFSLFSNRSQIRASIQSISCHLPMTMRER